MAVRFRDSAVCCAYRGGMSAEQILYELGSTSKATVYRALARNAVPLRGSS